MSNKRPSIKKQHLAEKICVVCEKPFTWRKKWARVWHQVKYCSERCRRARTKEQPRSTKH